MILTRHYCRNPGVLPVNLDRVYDQVIVSVAVFANGKQLVNGKMLIVCVVQVFTVDIILQQNRSPPTQGSAAIGWIDQ